MTQQETMTDEDWDTLFSLIDTEIEDIDKDNSKITAVLENDFMFQANVYLFRTLSNVNEDEAPEDKLRSHLLEENRKLSSKLTNLNRVRTKLTILKFQ